MSFALSPCSDGFVQLKVARKIIAIPTKRLRHQRTRLPLGFNRILKQPAELGRALPFGALPPTFRLHTLPLDCGNDGGEVQDVVCLRLIVFKLWNTAILCQSDDVVAGHHSHSMTVTASQMIKPTGTPITPANSSSTNRNCRKLGGGIPPTVISTSVVLQNNLERINMTLYLSNVFSLVHVKYTNTLATLSDLQVTLQ
jgi:hypothetical protein